MTEIVIANPTVKLGQSSGNCETLTNVQSLLYDWVNKQYPPRLVVNTTNPVGFHKVFKWVIGELHCVSEAYHAFYHNGSTNKAYIIPNGDNVEVPYFVVTQKDRAGKTWTYTFTGVLPVDDAGEFRVGRTVVRVYPFMAKYVTVTPP